jgi:hypothetical protein
MLVFADHTMCEEDPEIQQEPSCNSTTSSSPSPAFPACYLWPILGRRGSKRRHLTSIQGNAGQSAETMRKNAEQNRGHDGQLDRFLPWYMRFLAQENEAEHDGGESTRAEPSHILSDFVVDHWPSDGSSSSHRDVL